MPTRQVCRRTAIRFGRGRSTARGRQLVRRGACYEVAKAIAHDLYAALAAGEPLERLRGTVARELEAGVRRGRLIAQLEDFGRIFGEAVARATRTSFSR